MTPQFQTNGVIPRSNPLHKKGAKLMQAAYEYWIEYNKQFSPGAVVVVENTKGHFLLFTRSEYKNQMLSVVDNLSGHPPIERPFEA